MPLLGLATREATLTPALSRPRGEEEMANALIRVLSFTFDRPAFDRRSV